MASLPILVAFVMFVGLCLGIDKLLARGDRACREQGLRVVPMSLFALFASSNVLFAVVFALMGGRFAADILGTSFAVSHEQLDTLYSIGAFFGGIVLFVLGTWQQHQLEGRSFVLQEQLSSLVEDVNWSVPTTFVVVPALCGGVFAFVEAAGTEAASSRGAWLLFGVPTLASAWLLAARPNGRMILLVPCLFFLSGFEVGAAAALADGRTFPDGAQLAILFGVGFMVLSSVGMIPGGILRAVLDR